MFRPIAVIFRLLQFCSKSIIYIYICLYCEVMLRFHHRYALQSVYLVGSLMFNDWWDVNLWVGIGGVGGLFGGRDNRLCCVWHSVGLGVRG